MERLFIGAIGEYGSMIRARVAQRVGKETPDWEDIVSEVYLSLWGALNNGFRGDCSLGTLIYVITNRRIADYFKRRYRGKEEVPILLPLGSGAMSVEKEYELKETRGIIIKKLNKLERENGKCVNKDKKFRQKEVIMLYLGGYKRSEIAEELKMKDFGVTNCLRKARANLKNMEV